MSDLDTPSAAGEPALDSPTPPADDADDACELIEEHAAMRAMHHLERARKLGRRLRVQVQIDETGWLRNEIEVLFSKESDGALRPVLVRVGSDATDDAVLADGSIVARCTEYNAALAKLRQLAERLAALVHQERVHLEPGSPVAYAYRLLSRLDELIASRQRITMGYGVVRRATLCREIEFFGRVDAQLAPIVQAIEPANASTPRDPLGLRKLARWLRWWNARRTATRHPHDASGPYSGRTT